MSPKPAKRDLDRSVTERPAKSEDEEGNPGHANGGIKREWICSMADPVAVWLHDMWVQWYSTAVPVQFPAEGTVQYSTRGYSTV